MDQYMPLFYLSLDIAVYIVREFPCSPVVEIGVADQSDPPVKSYGAPLFKEFQRELVIFSVYHCF